MNISIVKSKGLTPDVCHDRHYVNKFIDDTFQDSVLKNYYSSCGDINNKSCYTNILDFTKSDFDNDIWMNPTSTYIDDCPIHKIE